MSKKIKSVKFRTIPVDEEFTCYGTRYLKINEDQVQNLDTNIVVTWKKNSIVAKVIESNG